MFWYIDDNGTIYGNDSSFVARQAQGTTASVSLGLADITTNLPDVTISSMLVDRVTFKFQASLISSLAPYPGPSDHGYVLLQAGVKPQSVSGATLRDLDDYQDIKGWPIKNGSVYLYTDTTPGTSNGGIVSWTMSYKPRNTLALNRLQDINLAFHPALGDFTVLSSIQLQASRGKN